MLILMMRKMMKMMRMIAILKICHPMRRIMEGGNRMEAMEKKKMMMREIMKIQRFLHKTTRNNRPMGFLIALSGLHKI